MALFGKILIANRGEIAVRIIRTLKEMGIRSVVVFAEPEKEALFVKLADESFSLGNGSITETYLNIDKIIDIALKCKADAIHPGYGFLSENFDFATSCKNHNIVFIGPSPEIIRLMGHKTEALKLVDQLGIPTLRIFQNTDISEINPGAVSYPVLVKPAAGGGGKGMHIIHNAEELIEKVETSKREALQYFGNDEVFLETYIRNPRHIEVQVLGDVHGNVIHLFDRECSIQRRHQKIIEEAPSPSISGEVREKIVSYALNIAKHVGYFNAGTVEFLMDEAGKFYFIEMNTRIQVEHPVTEAITGIDIVKEQVRIASGEKLSIRQNELTIDGHAIECRVYAEDAFNNFLPQAGVISLFKSPEIAGVRTDTAIEPGSHVLSEFDPMLAKIIVVGKNREESHRKMTQALSQTVVHGIRTNIDYLKEIIENPGYTQNKVSVNYSKHSEQEIEILYQKKLSGLNREEILALLLAFEFLPDTQKAILPVFETMGYWRQLMRGEYQIFDEKYRIIFRKRDQHEFWCFVNGSEFRFKAEKNRDEISLIIQNKTVKGVVSVYEDEIFVTIDNITITVNRNQLKINNKAGKVPQSSHENEYNLISPLHGKVIKVNRKIHDKVKKGEVILVIESMKMENNILAPSEGCIQQMLVNAGDKVAGKELLAVIA